MRPVLPSAKTLGFSLGALARIAILGWLCLASASAQAQTAPFWIQSDAPAASYYPTYVPSGRELIGQSMVLAPLLSDLHTPRYDYRSLLTFGAGTLEETRAFGDGTHEISYDEHAFTFDRLAGDASYSLREDRDGRQYLISFYESGDRVVYRLHGGVRPVDAGEARRFRAHLATVAEEERARRAAELRAAKGDPLPAIETYHHPPSARTGAELIWSIYYGRFDDLQDPRLVGDRPDLRLGQAIVVDALVSNLYRSYHQVYSLHYGDEIDEPVTLAWDDLVIRDSWGNEINRFEGQKFKIRSRYKDGYAASAPTASDALGLLTTTFDSHDKSFDFGAMVKLINVGQACVLFLDAYKTSSPATVEHFEQNLERALFGRQPVRIEVPVEPNEVRRAPFRLPWEEAPTGLAGREQLDDYAISWVRPAPWEKRDRPYGIAVYDVGFPDTAQVVVSYKPEAIDDVLPYVNLWRDREYLDPVSNVSEQPMEHFEVEGRSGLLLSFSNSTQVLIHDGPRSWIVTMYGPRTTVAERLDELRDFVASFAWHGEPSPPAYEEAPRTKSKRDQAQVGRRRRGPGATTGGDRSATMAEAPETDDSAGDRASTDDGALAPRTPADERPEPPITTPERPETAKQPVTEPETEEQAAVRPRAATLSTAVESRCSGLPAGLVATLAATALEVEPAKRALDGCRLDLALHPPLAAAIEHIRSAIAGAGLALDDDRTFPSLGGRHGGRHFLRFSGPGAQGSALIDEYTSPAEVVIDLRLEVP